MEHEDLLGVENGRCAYYFSKIEESHFPNTMELSYQPWTLLSQIFMSQRSKHILFRSLSFWVSVTCKVIFVLINA